MPSAKKLLQNSLPLPGCPAAVVPMNIGLATALILKARLVALCCLTLCVGGCARRHEASLSPLDGAFRHIDDIQLEGTRLGDVPELAMDVRGFIYAVNNRDHQVEEFDAKGRFLKVIGSKGPGPGQFLRPGGLACTPQNELYVLDTRGYQVLEFDAEGSLQRSFSYAALGWVGTDIALSPSGEPYIVGVNRLSPDPALSIVHKFDQQGDYLFSFFALDEHIPRLNLWPVAWARLALDAEGAVYAIQPANPHFFKFSPEGKFLGEFGRVPPFYEPPRRLPRPLSGDASKLADFFRQWTQAVNIQVLLGKLVVVTYWVHSPKAFALDIYDTGGHLVSGSLGTDLRPVFSDRNNVVYFAPAPVGSDPDSVVRLSRFNVRVN